MSIEVQELNGYKFIRKDGLTQSVYPAYPGGYWERMIPDNFIPQTALILGLGAGTICKVLRERFPNIGFRVVDYSEEMVKIAREFKVLDDFDIVTIEDAFEFVKTYKQMKHDLIIVDLFDGMKFDMRVITDLFLNDCKALLTDGGRLVVNVPNLSQCEHNFQEAKRNEVQNIYFYKS